MLFLVLGITFGDFRVVATMAGVVALIGPVVARERLGISPTITRLVLLAAIVGFFLLLPRPAAVP